MIGFRLLNYLPLHRMANVAVLSTGDLLTVLTGLLVRLESTNPVYQSSGGSASESDGDVVGEWQDISGNAKHATIGTTTNKPTYRLNVFNGLPAIEFDGTNDSLSISLSSTNGSYTIYTVIEPTATASARYFYDAATGRLVLALRSGADGTTVAYFDGVNWRGGYVPTVNKQILTWRLNSATGTGQTYRDGALLGSAIYSTVNIGGTQRIGSFNGGATTNPIQAKVAAILMYNGAHSDADRLAVHQYLSAKYGVVLA